MKEMKAIETFNNTNSELKRTVNMAFECILQRIEEASKLVERIFNKIFRVRKSKILNCFMSTITVKWR